jgi:hypothetical protein
VLLLGSMGHFGGDEMNIRVGILVGCGMLLLVRMHKKSSHIRAYQADTSCLSLCKVSADCYSGLPLLRNFSLPFAARESQARSRCQDGTKTRSDSPAGWSVTSCG